MMRYRIVHACVRAFLTRLGRLRNRHFFLLDACFLCLIPFAALYLRVEKPEAMAPYLPALVVYTFFALIARLLVFYLFGIYNCYWRSATVDDMVRLAGAMFTALLVVTPAYLIKDSENTGLYLLPRSLLFIDGLLVFLTVGAVRFGVRLAWQSTSRTPRASVRRALVVGAGSAGQMVVRELRASAETALLPVGFLDDDAEKQNMHILSLPVLGKREALPEVVQDHGIQQVIIAMPNVPGRIIRETLSLCEKAGVPAKTIPAMSAILEGRIRVSRLRNVEIEDLLRREPIETDIAAVRRLLRGKRVLVTGGGGSIGSELCRQVLQCEPAELVLLGHGENSVFEVHNELLDRMRRMPRPDGGDTGSFGPTTLHAVIADIRFRERMCDVFREYRPHVVFHAAAHKHVPLMEMNPAEALTNNVFGTQIILDSALAAGVEHFVMISTDKAVNPTSVMGASKRAAELLVLRAAHESGRPYVITRFGNVLGSRGSVVPIFRRQIAEGGPVTVSHPEMTRYFMTIPEAVQLVLQAAVLGQGGEVFMFDMGEPVKIVDLARDLIELSGLEVGQDIDIVFTGIRPGEKLFEELLLNAESYQPTSHEKIRIARDASRTIPSNLDSGLAAMQRAVANDDRGEVICCLRDMIPEFQPDEIRQEPIDRGSAVPDELPAKPVHV
jgi:FlaA1/EpsC-like NDP-sugar epimerase